MTRREIAFQVLDDERKYQIEKWSRHYDDSQWSVADWIVFIERYVQEAKDRIGCPNGLNSLHSIRKIGALAVACMEHRGIRTRAEELAVKAITEESK